MKNKELLLMISEELSKLYSSHEYNISVDALVDLASMIIEKEPLIDIDYLRDFVKRVKLGEYGTLYKMPTSLMGMLHRHLDIFALRVKLVR